MSESESPCQFVVDCAALHEIANTTSNSVKSICLDYLSKGVIAVPACVWHEFKEIYPDEAAAIAPYVKTKIKMKKAYLIGGAAIADRVNPGFPLSQYDEMTDYYAASISSIEKYTLITNGASQVQQYTKMKACKCVQVSDLVR